MSTVSLEALAQEYDSLRGDIVTNEGYDQLFAFAAGDATYMAIAAYWKDKGINLLKNEASSPVFAPAEPTLQANFELWDAISAATMAIDKEAGAFRFKESRQGEFRTHVDTDVGHVFLSNPYVGGVGVAQYVLHPPVSQKREKWNLFGYPKQLITGPDPDAPTLVSIDPALLLVIRGCALEATNFYTQETRMVTIPHGVIAPMQVKRDLVASHTSAA